MAFLHTPEAEEAARVLMQIDPYKYEGIIEALVTKRHPVMESRIYATEGKPPSIALIHRLPRDYVKTGFDAYLFLARRDDACVIAEALPANTYMLMYDDETVSYIKDCLPVQLSGTKYQLYLTPEHQCPTVDGNEIIRLTEEHDFIVMASESSIVHSNWDFCKEFKDDFEAFAIIKDGKIISFCAIGPDRLKAVEMPTREIAYIYTETAYRGQGFAKALLSKATQYLLTQGISAYYSIVSDNTASYNTAKAVGYIQCGKLYGYYRTQ